MQLKTHQTGPEGQKVRRLLIEEGADIKKEYYVAVAHRPRDAEGRADGARAKAAWTSRRWPTTRRRRSSRSSSTRSTGLTDAQAAELATGIGVPAATRAAGGRRVEEALRLLHGDRRLADRDQPADPRGRRTAAGTIKALDAKFNFDSNALFRHPEIVAYRDLDEEDPAEIEASKFDLAYIQLDGNIGCLVNGAGLAMATMDTIKLFGGEPANFLDVGGGATAEKVTEAFKIMLGNPKVKAILVNIFGGIMRCDTIAEGVIAACKAVNLTVPLVVRMKGTNEELGKKMLADSGLPIISADSMADAAKAVMAALK